MKRHEPYDDPNANPYAGSHMQHMYAQRMRPNAAMKNYPERPDAPTGDNEHMYRSTKVDGHWQRDRDAQITSIQTPSHLLHEDQGGNGARSFYAGQVGQVLDPKKQEYKEDRVQQAAHEEDMEIGYGENPSPLSYEGLEKKTFDEITKLVKEQSDAEDKENTRHREKMIEINTQYQEKLMSLRARQANRRDKFLRNESQLRLQQYQQTAINRYPTNPGPVDPHAYTGSAAAPTAYAGDERRSYAANQFDGYRERPQFQGTGRAQSTEGRVPYPSGRVYNTGTNVYYPDIP